MFLKIRKLASRTSIRLRLSLLFAVIFGVSLTVFGIGTFEVLTNSLQKEFDDALYNYAIDVSESISLDPSGDLSLTPPQVDRQKIYPFSLGTALIQIRHRSGRVLEQVGNFGHLDIPYRRDVERLSLGEDPVYRTLTKLEGLPTREAQSYRVISISIDTNLPPQLILQIVVPMTLLESQIENRKAVYQWAAPLILLLASLFAYLLSARALLPIREIIQKSHRIEVSNLSQRLPLPEAQDEVRELAITLNQMFGRLEMAFQSQERFIADASHQMLTPLSILRGELEQNQRSQNWDSTLVGSLLQEVDRLTKLVQDLLVLARVDAGVGALVLQPIDLDEVVMEAYRKAEKIARGRGIRLSFNIRNSADDREPPQIEGDSNLLYHLIFNLIENAIKYSPNDSLVQVVLEQTLLEQHLTIEDSGPGLNEDEIDGIFERFRRGRPKNPQAIRPGYGLGLAIAAQIARAHGAALWAENRRTSDGSVSGAVFHFEVKNF